MSDKQPQPQLPAGHAYPYTARWVQGFGWIEIGVDLPGDSFIQALDEGGMVWQGASTYPALDDALRDLEAALAAWFREQRRA